MKISDPKAFVATDIAVIGISARFPGATNYNMFWNNLLNETESIFFFDNQIPQKNFVNAKPFIENSDFFDAAFFDISSREAALMDPQHRLLLQSAWHAFEDAGYMPKEVSGRVGVFATSNFNSYQHVNGWFSHYWKKNSKKSSARFLAYTGNIQDTLATRISYKLNLTGPSVTVQTACSSSLVAMHLGCQSLLMGESDLVLVGASALSFPDKEGYYYEPGMILSSDGHCRSFDKEANGTIFGNGVSCVILKPLDQARLDNDYIYGVIKGSAINNDGSRKVDFNAPSIVGQEEVIQQAHELSGVHPETISYVEAHGTGTIIGDPIEFVALCNAFRSKTDKQQFCGIGSVKTNIGHLDAASGFAGFIKTILALDRQVIPSTIHYRELNPNLELTTSPFYIIDKEKQFKTSSDVRRCAVTSLGIGGTNAHFVLQEAPRSKTEKTLENQYIGLFPFLISADTLEQLQTYLAALLKHIQTNRSTISLSDVIYTLAISRIRKRNRCLGFFYTLDELEDALSSYISRKNTSLKFFESNEEANHAIIENLPIQCSKTVKECVRDWILGNKITQHIFFDEFQKARIPLPGYPFLERRYWYDQIEGLEHLEKFQTTESNLNEKGNLSLIQLDKSIPFIRDHVIDGQHIFPAAGYISIVQKAISHFGLGQKNKTVIIKSLSFSRAIIVEDTSVNIEIIYDGQQEPNLVSIKHGDIIVFKCYLDFESALDNVKLENVIVSCGKMLSNEAIYDAYLKQGIQYGPTFQLLKKIYKNKESKIIGEIEISKVTEPYPPQVIDAALQTALGMLLLDDISYSIEDGFIPSQMKKVVFSAPVEAKMYVILTPHVNVSPSYGIEYDVSVYGEQGNPIFILEGVLEKPLNRLNESPIRTEENQLLLLEKRFLTWFAKATNNPLHTIKLDVPLENYNIDSILAIALTEQMSEIFGPVSKTLFFEHYTLRNILTSLQVTCNKVFNDNSDKADTHLKSSHSIYNNKRAFKQETIEVAIVGASGYYPFSNTLEELWDNLVKGRNLITEIPKERWDHSLYYSEKTGIIGKTYSKWGGFIDNIYMFDPLFFKISPREAALLDPQERLFLQIAWMALEDAGYTPNSINLKTDHSIGVYVGAMYQEYQLFGIEERSKQNPVIINGLISTIANRASYFLDFRGPSLSVDTMCSSSLTALNLAYQDLVAGNIKAALIGGVNVTAHPNKYLQLAQERMLSKDGLCRSFGPNGAGYVPSEGVGCVLIKSLADAEKDHDHIYGVIRGIDINHGGKSSGFTVPNAQAQVNVIKKALEKSGVSPSRVSYIEAHGTGTALGDPIEIQGLAQAFASEKKQTCSIGSIKSNMGHTEAAAGIAGLTKILLQFKHRKLVPSIHSETLNPNIHFENTPFKVQKVLEEWKFSGEPLVAALSSFGAGGSNAHLIIEEYCSIPSPQSELSSQFLIILSAKNQERLEAYARTMVTFIQSGHADGAHLADIAFTLAVGRESMPYRAAFICESKSECIQFLTSIYTRKSANNDFIKEVSLPADIKTEHMKDAIDKKNLLFIKEAWLKGTEIEWERLFESMDNHPKRISLPTYPFEQKICKYTTAPTPYDALSTSILHPLIHENISNLEEIRFKSHFDNQVPAIMDHKIHQRVIYPGAGYIEMALFVCQNTLNIKGVISLSQISFLKPFYLPQIKEEIYTSVVSQSSGIGIEIWGVNQDKEQIYFQTTVNSESEIAKENNSLFESGTYFDFYDSEACYRKYNEYNFNYGPLYQTIQSIAVGGHEALIQAELNSEESLSSFTIHPALLDAAFQSTIAFDFRDPSEYLYVPKEIESIKVYEPLTHQIFIHIVKKVDSNTSARLYDIKIFNQQKKLCVSIENFKEMPLLQNAHAKLDSSDVVYFTKKWKVEAASLDHEQKQKKQFLFTSPSFAFSLKKRFSAELTIFSDENEFTINNTISLFNSVKEHLRSDKSKEPTLFTCVFPESEAWKAAPLVGLFKVLTIEQPHLFGKVILLPDSGLDDVKILQIIENESRCRGHYVRYQVLDDQRFVEDYEEVSKFPSAHNTPLIRHNGVYLLLGGNGGIGQNCINFFASKKTPCTLVVTGRKNSALMDLNLFPKEVSVHYIPCDVSDREAVIRLVDQVTTTYGSINGVFHLAGVIRDSFLIRKTEADVKAVLKPKIEGLINIDFATQKHPLDYLILFSSDSSVYGNIGQSDYCAANVFLDEFAYYREDLKNQGLRHGLTKVINWPYWENGGMKLEQTILDRLYSEEGVLPLKTEVAFSALEKIFNSSYIQVVPLQGNRQKILKHFHHAFQKKKESGVKPTFIDPSLRKKVSEYLKNHLSNELKIESHILKSDSFFDDFGIDSILSMNIISNLEKKFGQLPKTLFFEYSTFGSIVDYFLNNHQAVFNQNEIISHTPPQIQNEVKLSVASRGFTPLSIRHKKEQKDIVKNRASIDVAIIGIAGRYPQADTLDELWNHLVQGKNCIEEIPQDRFDYSSIFVENTSQIGKTKSKWGGFLKNIYAFDPLFFKISKDEAERLDPQEKLFLQTAWHTIEDAGYTREKLNALSDGDVGVYVGSMYQEYQIFNGEQALQGNPVMLGGSAASIANRVSYFLNLKGPSLTLDTMCSSALTTIYLACQDLVKGKCKMAIAGGVNVSVHPNKYLVLSYENFLSSDGLCKSFGAGGDGYVPSEGVGAVLLKPLSSAIKDGDLIYGVIKGVDINHGGKAAGFTVPSANAQAAVIRSTIEQSSLSDDAISYIEAHGTGTSLGDPIEIAGLTQSFDQSQLTKKITVGSIKSNIGHCESAAGLASVTKVLLQMKHKILVPSIHSDPANPYIDFENIPLRVQKIVAPWDNEKRVALISSFGAGGSNASLIIEEFERQHISFKEGKMSKLFILSAQQQDRLDVYAKRFLQFFEKQNPQTFSLSSCIYTLQSGREAFKERVAIVFETLDDLIDKLTIFLEKKSHPDVFLSLSDSLNDMVEMSGIQEEFQEFISAHSHSYSPKIIGKLWVQNIKIDWNALYHAPYPQMMSLPTYPFAEIPCFFKRVSSFEKNDMQKILHPLIHENTSNFNQHQFTSQFTQQEPLLRDHVIQGEMILPGAAIAEMFLSATQILSGGFTHYYLQDLFWLQPLRMKNDRLIVHTVLKGDKEQIFAQLFDQSNNCMSQCTLSPMTFSDFEPQQFFSVEELKSEMRQHIAQKDIYERFNAIGFQFGKTFKTLVEINFSGDAFIAKIELHTESIRYSNCRIQPYLLDAMLQATIVLSIGDDSTLPFCIQKLIYSNSNQEARWIYGLKRDKSEKRSIYDLFLLDEQGQVILSLYGFHDAPINTVKETSEDSIDEVLELLKMNTLTAEETENALLILLGEG